MDPASVIGVIGVVVQVTQAIYNYGDAVKECKTEVAQLRCELFGLQAALMQIEQDLKFSQENYTRIVVSPNLHSPQSQEMLNETRRVLTTLASTLAGDSSWSKSLAKRIIWPLKRTQVQTLAAHLERLKTFFILAATQDSLLVAQDIRFSVDALHQSVQEIQKTQQENHIYLEAMKWFAPCDHNIAHVTASSSRFPGTSAWFLDEAFNEWAFGTGPFLWLNGKPGSGKTCLMSACTDRLLKVNCIACCFYCSYNDSSSQEPRSILGSLIAQLCRQDSTIRQAVIAAYRESESRNSLHELVKVPRLISLIREITRKRSTDIFFIVDAVDECGDHVAAVLEAVFTVVRCGCVRLVLSSTENIAQTIVDVISLYNLPRKEVKLDISKVSSDINTYIEARFARESRLKRLRHDLQVSLIKKLQSQHGASFRWASCTIDDLLRRTTPKAIKSTFDGVATTLSDIYMGILQNIPDEKAEAINAMLSYLVAAKRPLTLEELGEAISLTFSDDFDEDDRLIEPEAIVNSLHSLLHCDPSNQHIELAHSSVRVFLTSPELSGKYHIDPIAANILMSRACIYYLTLPPFQQTCPDETALEARKGDWPFLEYASCFWTRHTRTIPPRYDKEYLSLFSKLAASANRPGGGNFAAWYQCIYPRGNAGIWETKPLYMCAREGLLEPLKTLLADCTKEELERRGGVRGSTPLHVAATYGEVEVVKLLLAAGADPNERNGAGENGIQLAALGNHHETVRVLLGAGASPSLLECMDNTGLFNQEQVRRPHRY